MAAVTHATTALWNTTTGSATNKNVTATPAANDLIVVIAGSTGLAGGTTGVTDNNADGLGTYTQVDTDRTFGASTGVLTVWVRNALVGSATSTVFTAPQNGSSGGGLDVFRISGMSLAGATAVRQAAGQSAGTTGTTPAPAMGGAVLTGNPVIGAVANSTSAATLTPRTGYTEATDLGYSTPTTGLETMFISSGETASTITWGSTSGSAFASVAIELDTSVPEDSPALELSGFGADTLVHSYDTINSVKVSYTHHETAGTLAPTLQLWDGTSSQIGATFTCTTSTSDVTDTAAFTGVTYSQLATLRVRVFAHGTTGHVESADAAGIVVNYTAGTPPPAATSLPPQQAPAWHPAAGPSAPGGTPFQAWPAWEGATLQAAATITATASAAGAAAVTADSTVTALASQAVSLTGPDLLPGLPGGQAFEAWPVWEGATAPSGPVTVTGTASAAGAGAVTAVVTEIPAASAAGAGAVTALATQIAPATAAGAGAVTDVATQAAITTSAAAGAVSDVVTQAATAASAGASAVTDVVTQIATAAAAGAGSVTAVGASSGAATATAAGAGAVTDVVTQIAPATSAGAGAVTTAVTQAATAAAAGAAAVTDAVTQIAPATSAGTGSVSDVVTQIAVASAAGAGAVTAAGASSGSATATAAGAAAVTAVATVIAPATAAGTGSVTDVATQIAKATAAAAGAVNASGVIPGTASVAGAASASAKAAQAPVATAAAAGSLSALATQQATAVLAAAGQATATGTIQLAFTVGTLTATDAPAAVLTAATAPGGTTAGNLTATDQRTGGPA